MTILPYSQTFDQSTMQRMIQHNDLVQDYRPLFALGKRLLFERKLIDFDERRCRKEGGCFGYLRLHIATARPAGLGISFGLP
jgi:hypothetical protein